MYTNECDVCKVAINAEDFQRLDDRMFYSWKTVDGKVKKVNLTASHYELVDMFNAEIKVLKKHIFVKREQNKFYNNVKDNLEENEVLIHVDYSENYSNKDQQEIQSAYFGHDTFSLFTACCYFRGDNGETVSKNITVTSNATDHSRIAAHTCIMKVIEELSKTVKITKIHVWSDGCSAQFRSRFVFFLISRIDKKYEVNWFYNERHHGKGPMDGVGGTMKNKVFRDVKSGKVQINDAESFAEYADNTINGIKSLYLPESHVFDEPDDIENAPRIVGTLEVHKVVREFNDDGVCKQVCDHPVLSLLFDQDNTCASCREPYLAIEDWLECNVCEQWFHERCFMH